jgi:hypothetical protein
MVRSLGRWLVALAAVAVMTGPAAAQDLTTGDITRLQQMVDQLASDIVELRQRDRVAARDLRDELDEIEEDVIYLRVKLRRERSVPRADYQDVEKRIDSLRMRVRNVNDPAANRYPTTGTTSPTTGRTTTDRTTRTADPGVVPVGTEIDVRLEQTLSSDTAQVEDRFEATTVVDLQQNGRVLIPAGSRVRGVVTAVKNAGRVDRKGELQLSFDQITVNGRNYPFRGTVIEALEAGGYREDAEKIGAGAAVGAILGGILGGVKGAITGILIGGGGVVAATEGEDVTLASGTILRMRLDQDLDVARR